MWKFFSIPAALFSCTGIYFGVMTQKTVSKENLEELTRELSVKENSVKSKRTELKEKQEDLRKIISENVEQQGKLQDLKTKADEFYEEVGEIKTKIDEESQTLTSLQGELEGLGPGGDVDTLKIKLASLESEISDYANKIANSEEQKAYLEKKISRDKDTLQKTREKLLGSTNNRISKDFSAKIQSVYPSWGFVVLNKGVTRGSIAGADLVVTRGGSNVAKLRIRNVEQNVSVADIVKGSLGVGASIFPGDMARADLSARRQTPKRTKITTPSDLGKKVNKVNERGVELDLPTNSDGILDTEGLPENTGSEVNLPTNESTSSNNIDDGNSTETAVEEDIF